MLNTSIAAALSSALDLKQAPVAVTFSAAPVESGASFSGTVAAGCMFWEQAADKSIQTNASHHEMCSIGVYTHNLANPSASYASELKTVLHVLGELSYARDEDVAQIPVLKSRPASVHYAPLAQVDAEPDVVLLFTHSADSLIVSEAVQQVEGGIPPAMGRPACAVIPQVMNSGKAALSLGCCGARAYLSVLKDDTALWALPGPKLQEYADRIVSLSEANRILSRFHTLRLEDVANGRTPSYQESMARLQS